MPASMQASQRFGASFGSNQVPEVKVQEVKVQEVKVQEVKVQQVKVPEKKSYGKVLYGRDRLFPHLSASKKKEIIKNLTKIRNKNLKLKALKRNLRKGKFKPSLPSIPENIEDEIVLMTDEDE